MDFKTNKKEFEGMNWYDIAEQAGIKPASLRSRQLRHPDKLIEDLLYPVDPTKSYTKEPEFTVGDVTMTVTAWAESVGITRSAMKRRFASYPPEVAVELRKGEHRRKAPKKTLSQQDVILKSLEHFDEFDENLELKRRIERYTAQGLSVDEMKTKERHLTNWRAAA